MTRGTVAVIEDDKAIRRGLVDALRFHGFVAIEAADGESGLATAIAGDLDLVLLDVLLPKLDGFTVLARLREVRPALPVIMLTARGQEEDRVRGLGLGADDYVVKPFSVPEFMARVHALLRRASPERVATKLAQGDIELDRDTRRVWRAGREIHLGPTEFRLLEYLLEKPGRVFSRAQLLDSIWGMAAEIDERTVDVHVGRLRKALSRGRERDPLRTVRGSGYAFDETFGKERADSR